MASNECIEDKKREIIIALLSLSDINTQQFCKDGFTFVSVPLDIRTMDNKMPITRKDADAVVLFHSTKEGRCSITDVEDAKYDTLLPNLRKEFGEHRVGVVVHSLPEYDDSLKHIFQEALRQQQPTMKRCSECVITCGPLNKMPEQDLEFLFQFLEKAPLHKLPDKPPILNGKPLFRFMDGKMKAPHAKGIKKAIKHLNSLVCFHNESKKHGGLGIVYNEKEDLKIITDDLIRKKPKNETLVEIIKGGRFVIFVHVRLRSAYGDKKELLRSYSTLKDPLSVVKEIWYKVEDTEIVFQNPKELQALLAQSCVNDREDSNRWCPQQ